MCGVMIVSVGRAWLTRRLYIPSTCIGVVVNACSPSTWEVVVGAARVEGLGCH